MDKNEKILFLLPYNIKTNLTEENVMSYMNKRKGRMLILLIIVSLFGLAILVNSIINQFQSTSDYLLVLSAMLNVGVFYSNYQQYNFTKDEVINAISHYKKLREI